MTNTVGNLNRYRISSKFILAKIIIALGLCLLIYSWSSDFYNQVLSQKTAVHFLGTLLLLGIFIFLSTAKRIEYDNVECKLYVFHFRGQLVDEIPVEKIDKILYSAIGLGRGLYSYVFVYKDIHGQRKKARLFPIPFSNYIDTIITDTKLRNPNVVTRNWSLGINELFD